MLNSAEFSHKHGVTMATGDWALSKAALYHYQRGEKNMVDFGYSNKDDLLHPRRKDGEFQKFLSAVSISLTKKQLLEHLI